MVHLSWLHEHDKNARSRGIATCFEEGLDVIATFLPIAIRHNVTVHDSLSLLVLSQHIRFCLDENFHAVELAPFNGDEQWRAPPRRGPKQLQCWPCAGGASS